MKNQIIDAIKNRRSIRNFKNKKIEEEKINEIIDAGRYAPSAEDRQPWKFIVISDKKLILELSNKVKNEIQGVLKKRFIKKYSYPELKDERLTQFMYLMSVSKEDRIFYNAPLLVLIVCKDEMFNDVSCACCAENMMLAAHSLDIGSCWIGFANFLGLDKQTIKDIGVPENHHISVALIFGYPEEKKSRASYRKMGSTVINRIK